MQVTPQACWLKIFPAYSIGRVLPRLALGVTISNWSYPLVAPYIHDYD